MKKESLEKRLYAILSDSAWHSSYALASTLNGLNRPLFRLSGRTSGLKARGVEIEMITEKRYHELYPQSDMKFYPLDFVSKRVWYKMVWTPENPWAIPLKKYERKDTTELTTTLADGTILGLI